MNCPAISAKEDTTLIAAAMRAERFCHLNFYRRVGEMRGENIDFGGEAVGVEHEVKAVMNDITDNNGVLVFTFEHLERVLKAVEQTLRHYRNGALDQ